MAGKNCLKCGNKLSDSAGKRGPSPSYCSEKCRRAAEFELRRIQRAIERAEKERDAADLKAATVEYPGLVKDAETRRDWWTGQVDRLEARLRELLADDAVKVSPS